MSRCDQVNAFLSTFDCYKQANASRMAYEIKPDDKVDLLGGTWTLLQTAKGTIDFTRSERDEVVAGDFVEIIKWPECAVHWPREQFIAQTSTENVINRGDATLETWGPGNLQTSGTVIKLGSRYFIEIKNGRVMTACYINGATRYGRVIDEDKKRNKALAELEARKKNPQLLEVGFWSRTVETVQGGAA